MQVEKISNIRSTNAGTMDNEVTIKLGSKRKPHSYPTTNTERWDAKPSSHS